ncbi:MAG: hypothetical protein JXB30_11870 [Anaerolineae bacterium]|nr:hypothetical protein [Anaerolineae bacterium]
MDTQSQPDFRQRPSLQARNLKTAARFKREAWWQITFPVIAAAFLLIGGMVALFYLTGASGISTIADYSVILLSIPALIIGLVVLVVTIVLIGLVMLLIQRIPPYTFVVQGYFEKIHNGVVGFIGKITGALISILSIISGISLFLKQQAGTSNNNNESASGPTEPGAGPD